nr:MAG TPA: hypothetical protein [Caudoviricetes sp.]DAL17881.1 MAG TPA_asm: hypothetical protein [Caudoviricetes sp.]
MSAETLHNLNQAIAAHLADTEPDAILTDWFTAYGSMSHDADGNNSNHILYGIHYATSDTSPHGALGIATLGLNALTYDLAPDEDD